VSEPAIHKHTCPICGGEFECTNSSDASIKQTACPDCKVIFDAA
jgi:hypothetical protein